MCNREVLVQQIHLLEGDFAALSLLRFPRPLGLTSKSDFSVSFQLMPSISLESLQRTSENNSTRQR